MPRSLPLDILRLLACFMVVLMHSPIPGGGDGGEYGYFLTALSYFTTPCVPLFFMVSGALLLRNGSDDVDNVHWLKCRIGKVVIPTIVFSLFYIFVNVNNEHWFTAILSIPFSTQGHGVLWFMYTLVGLYLITPIIKPWLKRATKSEVRLYLIIWGISLLYPYIEGFVAVNRGDTGVLYYLSGYVGYFLLGHYLTRWQVKRPTIVVLLVLTALVLPLPLFNKVCGWNLNFYSAFWYLSAPVCVMTMTYFSLFTYLFRNSNRSYPIITLLSNLAFGVYLVHIFIMRNILWEVDIIKGIENYPVQTILIFAVTSLLSFIVCYFLSLLPFGHYIIGYKHRVSKSA
ncbi:MAG: acyltransferase [Bacteroidia bacterium]|nr:acyltransferase [Bacteroidia bacterium]